MRRELGRGGPMCYADQQGLYGVVQTMKKFAANPLDDASFWQPAPLLAKLAAEGKAFTCSGPSVPGHLVTKGTHGCSIAA